MVLVVAVCCCLLFVDVFCGLFVVGVEIACVCVLFWCVLIVVGVRWLVCVLC